MISLRNSYAVIDSHTAGHPTRVIMSGLPRLEGPDVAAKRDTFRQRFDHLRPSLLHEPAGHAAMVALVPVASDQADFGAFFISTYVYLDMCGHATIGYAKTLAATGTIQAPLPQFTLETPVGVVTVGLDWDSDGGLASVRLANVPCWVGIEKVTVPVAGIGTVTADMAFGGIWYAVVDASRINLALEPDQVGKALAWGSAIKYALAEALAHADPELGGGTQPSVLFHTNSSPRRARHLLVLEANKFDRSPCGTGTSARLALLASRGQITKADTYIADNLLGDQFTARIAQRVVVNGRDAIIPEIKGSAYITSFATIVKETSDRLSGGFLCR